MEAFVDAMVARRELLGPEHLPFAPAWYRAFHERDLNPYEALATGGVDEAKAATPAVGGLLGPDGHSIEGRQPAPKAANPPTVGNLLKMNATPVDPRMVDALNETKTRMRFDLIATIEGLQQRVFQLNQGTTKGWVEEPEGVYTPISAAFLEQLVAQLRQQQDRYTIPSMVAALGAAASLFFDDGGGA